MIKYDSIAERTEMRKIMKIIITIITIILFIIAPFVINNIAFHLKVPKTLKEGCYYGAKKRIVFKVLDYDGGVVSNALIRVGFGMWPKIIVTLYTLCEAMGNTTPRTLFEDRHLSMV